MPQHIRQEEMSPRAPEKMRKGPIAALAIIAAAAIIAIIVFFAANMASDAGDPGNDGALPASEAGYTAASHVDWDEWQARNDNVYAWIEVPGTNIDLPVLQHPMMDDYYLVRTVDGEAEVSGAIYTQASWNSKDLLADPVTVLYGHTFQDSHALAGTMFSQLHEFEDPAFFDEHPEFVIYTPASTLTYTIVSAFEYDNRHLIQTNESFQDPEKLQAFFDMIQAPDSMNKNVRDVGPLVAGEDHVVVLSTCTMPSSSTTRYLVTGVLSDEQGVS